MRIGSIGKNKGKEPWNKGKTGVYSTETLEKISENAKQRHKDGKYDYEKLRLSRIGFKQPQSQKDGVSKKLAKNWSITSPDGNTIIINNLRKFCRENGLDQGNMSANRCKGWKCIKLSP